MYEIDFDERLRRISTRRSGFWDSEKVTRYCKDLKKILSKTGDDFDMLIDLSEAIVSSQGAAILFEQLARDIVASPMRKAAFVSTGALARVQLRRILADDPRIRIFTNRQEAEAWLLAPDPA